MQAREHGSHPVIHRGNPVEQLSGNDANGRAAWGWQRRNVEINRRIERSSRAGPAGSRRTEPLDIALPVGRQESAWADKSAFWGRCAGELLEFLVSVERPTRRTLDVGLQSGDGATLKQALHFRDVTHEIEVGQMKSDFLPIAARGFRAPMPGIYEFTEHLSLPGGPHQ